MSDYIDQIAHETAKRLCADPSEHNRFKAEIAGAIIRADDRRKLELTKAPTCKNCGKPAVGQCESTSIHHRV